VARGVSHVRVGEFTLIGHIAVCAQVFVSTYKALPPKAPQSRFMTLPIANDTTPLSYKNAKSINLNKTSEIKKFSMIHNK